MTWSVKAEWPAGAPEPINHNSLPQTLPDGCESAVADQMYAAGQAVDILMGAVGHPEHMDGWTVQMTGHANPDHNPTPGWADEFIAVTVTRRRPA